MKKSSLASIGTSLAIGMTLSACQLESDSTNSNSNSAGTSGNYSESTIDASSQKQYIDLDSNSVVSESDSWDISFDRYSIEINNDVKVAIIAEQNDFYDGDDPLTSAFVNATAAGELNHLTADIDLNEFTFEEPSIQLIMDADGKLFYDYDFTTHLVSANDDAIWVIRSNTGQAYAKFRATEITYDTLNSNYTDATFELHIQNTGEDLFSATASIWTVNMDSGTAHECFDIETAASVDCSSDDWDIEFDFNPNSRVLDLRLNGGVSGSGKAAAVYTGAYDISENDDIKSGIQNDGSDSIEITSYHYAQDSQLSAFSEYPWYAYSINGGHAIWPNYRVYGIETSEGTYLIQLTNYYNDTAVSGHITYRLVSL